VNETVLLTTLTTQVPACVRLPEAHTRRSIDQAPGEKSSISVMS